MRQTLKYLLAAIAAVLLITSPAYGQTYNANALLFGSTNIPTGTAPTPGECLEYDGTSITGTACSGGGGSGTVTDVTGTNGISVTSGTTTPVVGLPACTADQLLIENSGATAFACGSMGGDCTISAAGVITCTETNGTPFAASATTNTTDAANISSGTLAAARLPNPSATTLGGIESLASTAHEWIDAISTAGAPSASQPASTDLSDLPIPVSSGGTGTTSPSLVAGSNITISGSWPDQTVSATGGGGGGGTVEWSVSTGPQTFGSTSNNLYLTGSQIAANTASQACHFTSLTCVNVFHGSTCTTPPTVNVFDGASNTGTAIQCSNAKQSTLGTVTTQAETQTIASGDVYGLYISAAGGTCTTDEFYVSADIECP